MTTRTYSLRPILYWITLLLMGAMVLYPVYLVHFAGKYAGFCSNFTLRWGIIEISHLLLWTAIFCIALCFFPLRLERDDDRVEFRLVMLACTVPCPYDQIIKVEGYWLPCYVKLTTTLGSIILNPSGGVQAFLDDYEDARLQTSDRYGDTGPASAPVASMINSLFGSQIIPTGAPKRRSGTGLLAEAYCEEAHATHARKAASAGTSAVPSTDPEAAFASGGMPSNFPAAARLSYVDESMLMPPTQPPLFTGSVEEVAPPSPPPQFEGEEVCHHNDDHIGAAAAAAAAGSEDDPPIPKRNSAGGAEALVGSPLLPSSTVAPPAPVQDSLQEAGAPLLPSPTAPPPPTSSPPPEEPATPSTAESVL